MPSSISPLLSTSSQSLLASTPNPNSSCSLVSLAKRRVAPVAVSCLPSESPCRRLEGGPPLAATPSSLRGLLDRYSYSQRAQIWSLGPRARTCLLQGWPRLLRPGHRRQHLGLPSGLASWLRGAVAHHHRRYTPGEGNTGDRAPSHLAPGTFCRGPERLAFPGTPSSPGCQSDLECRVLTFTLLALP